MENGKQKFMLDNTKVIGNIYQGTVNNISQIRGEFCIERFEGVNKHVYTDPWCTKGAWRGYKPNTHEVFDVNGALVSSEPIVKWNLDQYKDSMDDCVQAVIKSIQLRYEPNCLLLLSGGIDSSVVAVILHDLGHYVTCLTVNENTDQIQEYCSNHEFIRWDDLEKHPNLSHKIAKFAKEQLGKHIILTGNVSDGPYYNNDSAFKFPNKLEDIFPWPDFDQNRTLKLCKLWDLAAYKNGVDYRFCFADRVLMQEFLNLSPELKNVKYKYHISVVLEQRGFDLSQFKKLKFVAHNIRQ